MNYKIITATVATVISLSANANAACFCSSIFNSSACSIGGVSKFNPQYWACAGFLNTVNALCNGMFCKGSNAFNDPAKAKLNEDACSTNKDSEACAKLLEQDAQNLANELHNADWNKAIEDGRTDTDKDICNQVDPNDPSCLTGLNK